MNSGSIPVDSTKEIKGSKDLNNDMGHNNNMSQ